MFVEIDKYKVLCVVVKIVKNMFIYLKGRWCGILKYIYLYV